MWLSVGNFYLSKMVIPIRTRAALAIRGLGNFGIRVQNMSRRPPPGRGERVEVGWDAGEAVALRTD